MPSRCTICAHPSRTAIDAAIIAGTPMRDVAGHFRVSRSAVSRHQQHIRQTIAAANTIAIRCEAQHAVDLRDLALDLEALARDRMNLALASGHEAVAAGWYDRLLKSATFRLTVETARPPRRADNTVDIAIERQGALAKVAEQFLKRLLERQTEVELPPTGDDA